MILSALYRNGTHTARVFNLIYHALWLTLLILHLAGSIIISIPDTFEPSIDILICAIIFNIILTIISLTSSGRRRTLCKYVSLLFGSLIQLIISYKYIMVYPPLSPTVITSAVLALWFFIGAMFIKKENKEDINGNSSTV